MTHCLNTLANLIQQYIWLAPVLALLGGLVTSFTPCSLSSVPMVIAYIGGSAKNDTKKAFRLSLTMAGGLVPVPALTPDDPLPTGTDSMWIDWFF